MSGFSFFFLISLTSRGSEQIWHSQHTANNTTTNVFVGNLEGATHVIMYVFIFRGKQQLAAAPAVSLYLGQNEAISSSLHALSQLFYSDTLFLVVPYGAIATLFSFFSPPLPCINSHYHLL